MIDPDRERMLKEMAANRGCKLVKSRRRKPGTGDFGCFGLKDAGSDREVFGFAADGLLTASPEEIEAFLRKGAVADWKSSLAAAAAGSAAPANDERTPVRKPAKPARKRKAAPVDEEEESEADAPAARAKPQLRLVEREEAPAPPPAPPPPPPPPPAPRPVLRIREARPGDAEALADLLGGSSVASGLATRISALRKEGEPPLVVDEGGALLGLVAFHAVPLVQEEAPLGRLTFLLVAPTARRRGLGRALVEEAAARLADRGCTRVEALAEIELAAAPDFFRRLGWSRNAYRYATELPAS